MLLDPRFINGLQECLAGAPWGMLWDWLQEQHYHVATPEWQFTWLVGRYGLRPEESSFIGCGYGWFMHPVAGNTSSVCVKPRTVHCKACDEIWGKQNQDKTPAAAYQRLFDNMYKHTCGWLEWLEETKEINSNVPRPLIPDKDWGWYCEHEYRERVVVTHNYKKCYECIKLIDNNDSRYTELWEWAESNDHNHPHLEELYAIHHLQEESNVKA